jgi:TolB-like protein
MKKSFRKVPLCRLQWILLTLWGSLPSTLPVPISSFLSNPIKLYFLKTEVTRVKLFLIILSLSFMLLLSSCVATKSTKPEQISQLYIDGTVQTMIGNELVLVVKLPELKKVPESPIHNIAQHVVQKSLFLEGIKTEIDGVPAIIKEVRGNIVSIILEKPKIYPPGAALKLKIPKKIIAIMDFEVIRGPEKEVGRITLEGLTSLLIESGSFIVVERSKLKTILSELELSQSGLTKETREQVVGKLLMADLILTGTLSEAGSIWDVNLRLVDVRTGQALAAVAMQTPLIKPSDMRDTSALHGVFAKGVDTSWSLGYRTLEKGFYSVSLDRSIGAEGTKGSLRIDFDFPAGIKEIFARMRNDQRRDLSFYSGIEFYIKATRPLFGTFNLVTSHPDDLNKIDYWVGHFEIETEWKKIEIPFNKLVIAVDWIKREPAGSPRKLGDQILRPYRIEAMSIGVWSTRNPPCKGTIWIDKVSSYK